MPFNFKNCVNCIFFNITKKVYKAIDMRNNSLVAIKVVKLNKFREVPKLEEFTMNEI